jgi:hypothetical protein
MYGPDRGLDWFRISLSENFLASTLDDFQICLNRCCVRMQECRAGSTLVDYVNPNRALVPLSPFR